MELFAADKRIIARRHLDKTGANGFFDSSESMKRPRPTPPAHPLCIFVVENHRDTLQLLRMYLEGMGHTVFSASTMKEALEALPGTGCEVLVSDIGLTDGNGWELLERLEQTGHRPRYAVAMSGLGMSADHLRSKEAGYRRHLLKPFVPDELENALAEAAQEAMARA